MCKVMSAITASRAASDDRQARRMTAEATAAMSGMNANRYRSWCICQYQPTIAIFPSAAATQSLHCARTNGRQAHMSVNTEPRNGRVVPSLAKSAGAKEWPTTAPIASFRPDHV